MPLLNFQKQFVNKIKKGKKRQTIRAMRKRPFYLNDKLYFYTGLRTKQCKKIGEAVCCKVDDIKILPTGIMTLNKKVICNDEKNQIALNDGFNNWDHMWLWFKDTYGIPFKGQLIKWDNLIIK